MARESVQKEVEVFRLYDLPPELRNLIYELHFLAACQDTRDLLSAAELAPKPDRKCDAAEDPLDSLLMIRSHQ